MNATEIILEARKNLESITNLEFNGVTGVSKEGAEWTVILELIERKSIPDTQDILGIYEAKLNEKGELVSFNRIKLRKRGETDEGGA